MSECIKINTGTPPVKHWCQYEQQLCEYANSWGMCSITACISKTRRSKAMAEYVDEKYAKEVLEVKDSFNGLDSLIPPKDDEIYINNKGAVLMSMNTLMGIWKHPEMKDRVFEKLEEMFLADYAIEECPSNDKEQEHE